MKILVKDTSNSSQGAAQVQQVPWWCPTMTMQGVCVVRTGSVRLPIPAGNWTIEGVTAQVSTAPTGTSLIADVRKNGTTIFSGGTGRPTIAASAFNNTTTGMSTTALTTGDYLTVDIAQIGSGVAGADLVVVVSLRRTS